MRYLLDTDTCIDLLRGHARVLESIAQTPPDRCALSTITAYELHVGALKCGHPHREQNKIRALQDTLHTLPFSMEAALQAAQCRVQLESEGLTIGPYDMLIAGQAMALRLTLVSSNAREFSRVEGLHVIDWRRGGQGSAPAQDE